ncbi:MAG: prepilin-type N-terminal cleavage/methylation domain-containing protein [Candidatus Marinimicrobia bacterium]|nr:prepilin-type N-terminal cleavage/methylation domain-containing protein [Candidatus Neomarinimicrobiota bacterium]
MRMPRGKYIRIGRGFTLVELLIVIALIGILVAMLFPAVQSAMNRANISQCQGSLRAIGQGIELYVGDNRNYLPPTEAGSHSWPHFLAEYLGLEPMGGTAEPSPAPTRWKPGKAIASGWWGIAPKNNVIWGCPAWYGADEAIPGYGMNARLEAPDNKDTGAPANVPQIDYLTYPNKRILIADAKDLIITGDGNLDPLRHGEGANYLFVDLHVEGLWPTNATRRLSNPKDAP